MAKEKGYIRLYRGVFDDKVSKEKFTKHEAWIDILQLAAYQDGDSITHRGIKIPIQRGQIALTLDELSERWSWSKKETRNQINKWVQDGQVTRPYKLLPLIELVNYEKYQGHTKSAKKGTQNIGKKGTQNEGLTSEQSNSCRIEQAKKGTQNIGEKGTQNEQKRAHLLKEIYIKENVDVLYSDPQKIEVDEKIEKEKALFEQLADYYSEPIMKDMICIRHHATHENIPDLIQQFKASCILRNQTHDSFADILKHFDSWLTSTDYTRLTTQNNNPNGSNNTTTQKANMEGNRRGNANRTGAEPSTDYSEKLW